MCCRGVSQSENVEKLIIKLVEGRGEQCLHGLVFTEDRGYRSSSFIRSLLRLDIGSILIVPEHLLHSHPFVGSSFFSAPRSDEKEADSRINDIDQENNDLKVEPDSSRNAASSVGVAYNASPDRAVREDDELLSTGRSRGVEFDRRRVFTIADNAGAIPAAFAIK